MSSTNRIQWLTEELGITYKVLSDIFRLSVSHMHMAGSGKRTLPPKKLARLDDPLFAPYDIKKEMEALPPPVWEDQDKEFRIKEMEARTLNLKVEINKTEKTIEAKKEKHRRYHTLLYHTRHLPEHIKEEQPLVEQWWIVIKNTAWIALKESGFSLSTRRKLELKLELLKTELEVMNRWRAEDAQMS